MFKYLNVWSYLLYHLASKKAGFEIPKGSTLELWRKFLLDHKYKTEPARLIPLLKTMRQIDFLTWSTICGLVILTICYL